jgi:UDPglucose--hexose-1-phosphate uridylyltransferase
MPELRKDYILDRFVIIATERSKRPHQFLKQPDKSAANICYFCPGHEQDTPKEIHRIERDGAWIMRVFDNKFSAVSSQGDPIIRTDNTFYTFAEGVGKHEVIVETSDHAMQLADLSAQDIRELIKLYTLRVVELSKLPAVRYVCVFKNSGPEAGCSIPHSHSQIIAVNLIPPVVLEKESASSRYQRCPYCSIIQSEKDSLRRIFVDEYIACFAPYASRFPFEAIILPRRHIRHPSELSALELDSLSRCLKLVLVKLKEMNAPYNMYLHYGLDKLHLQMTIAPRMPGSVWAGFELSSEIIINPVTPESAAEFYRG